MKKFFLILIIFTLFSSFPKAEFVNKSENLDGTLRYLIFSEKNGEFNNVLLDIAKKNKFSILITSDKKEIVDFSIDKSVETPEIALNLIREKFFSEKLPEYSTIFTNGQDGYAVFRIPSIIKTKNNTLVAFCEARGVGRTDCAENDIVAKTSVDAGKTWSNLILIASAGEASLNNPSPVYIEELNKIILMFQYYPPKSYEVTTIKGTEGNSICRSFTCESLDNGKTWSEKKDITKQVKTSDMSAICSGPGIGIRVIGGKNNGRIIFPYASTGRDAGWYNYIVYSDDLGETWKIANGKSWYGTNESQVVQIDKENFLVNARNHRFYKTADKEPVFWNPWNSKDRARCRGEFSFFMEKDFFKFSDTVEREDMPDPQCQGFIYRFSGLKENEKSILLFSNPASNVIIPVKGRSKYWTSPARVNGSIKISYDDGKVWNRSKRIYGDRWTGFQYSGIVKIDNENIGVIFEALPEIKFANISLKWLEK